MKKTISTNERVFMCLVGPSGSGKTRLIYDLLRLPVFQPRHKSVIYFYQHYQPIYDDIQDIRGLSVNFIEGVDFDHLNNLPTDDKHLVIFDDSSEEILKSPKFTKLAVAGRHQNFHVFI